jgi:hypothetical protein
MEGYEMLRELSASTIGCSCEGMLILRRAAMGDKTNPGEA